MSTPSDANDEERPAKRTRLGEAVEAAEPSGPNSLAYRLANQSKSSSAEALVGISAYVNPGLPAFERAIIKHRFTDFLVWEIAKGGKVVRLQDIARPATQEISSDVAEEGKVEGEPDLLSYMSKAKVDELEAFVQAGKSNKVIHSDPVEAKDARKAFHEAIRTIYKGKLATEVGKDNVIDIAWSSGHSRDRRSVRPSKQDQKGLPPFVKFTLQKTNRETQDCISQLASRLGVYPKDLTTAGTKDKRGVTTQEITLRRGRRTLEEVWDQVNGLHHGRSKDAFKGHKANGGPLDRAGMMPTERGDRGIRIGDLEYAKDQLDLGMLDGNRFCIVLRDIVVQSDETVDSALQTLRDTGFINYYGMQRFGNSSVPTHVIGLALLQSEWKEAARLILSEKDGDSDEMRHARRAWNDDRDVRKALKGIPKWAVAERCLLEFYDKDKGDLNQQGALARIPKNLRMMYVHAYQSYIWNSAVSARIKEFGCDKPVVGDLVYEQQGTAEPAGEVEGAAAAEATKSPITQDSLMARSKLARVKVLKEEDLKDYAIQDVVLPLPGYSVTYPEGGVGELYRSMMKADKLDPDNMFRSQKEFSLGGTYRRILTKPADLKWEVMQYGHPDDALLLPDEDKLLGMELPVASGDKKALKVEFSLDTASYATMALREILKMETGNVQQKEFSERVRAE